MKNVIGIDLGTTHSLVTCWIDGKAVLIKNGLDETLTPSCVSLDEDGSILVGRPAQLRLLTHPDASAACFKREMGTGKLTALGTQQYRPEELSSFVLRSLKADAEDFLGAPVEDVVITVPAYFSDAQRQATRAAGELAGLKVLRLINEPTAAALAYGIHETGSDKKYLVFDLGGGTFDVSVIDLFEGVIEVRASTGDNFLGGEDFTSALVQAFCRHHDVEGEHHAFSAVDRQQLRDAAELAKHNIGVSPSTQMVAVLQGKTHSWTVTASAFDNIVDPLLERLRQPVERALRDARIRIDELDEVILVGGATRMPVVRRLVSKLFGRLPSSNLNPDEAVGLGAAIQAALQQRDAALEEVVLTDVAPYSLGIETAFQFETNQWAADQYLPLIERNTSVPTSRSRIVRTIYDYQKHVELRIFQGESRIASSNIKLGVIQVPVPLCPAGQVSIDVRFTYDINGILEVEAKVLPDGSEHRLVIEENPGVLTKSEIEDRLASLTSLKIHPRDQLENRTLVARADRLYQEHLGEVRSAIAANVSRFQRLVESQDPLSIREARNQFRQFLDSIDSRFTY